MLSTCKFSGKFSTLVKPLFSATFNILFIATLKKMRKPPLVLEWFIAELQIKEIVVKRAFTSTVNSQLCDTFSKV